MSVQIDMTNYEAFYLDYLEGNLSGEALAAFEAFLLAHPELSVDESPMITLEPVEEAFDATSKLALKKGIDMNDLTEETIEFFLIAREEGLLDNEQLAQLNHWLEANAHYRRDAELYALIHLEADTSEVYAGKDSLKKREGGGRVIPMWWPGAAVAAGIALLVTIGVGTWNTPGSDHPVGTASHTPHLPVDSLKNNSADAAQSGTPNEQDQAGNRKDRQPKQSTGNTRQNDNKQTPPPKKRPGAYQQNHLMLHETVIASLEKRNAVLTTGDKSVTPMPVTPKQPKTVNPEESASANEDIAWVPVNEMKNPIQPVTTKLSTTLNTPVDFRTAKASKRKGGGFFLKIGKLEVSHQSGSQSASL
jgi:hypothetical protein